MDLLFLFFIAVIVSPRHGPALVVVDDDDNPSGATLPVYSPECLLGSNLPSSDPEDMEFLDNDIVQSTPRLYAWTFLEGPGR